MNKKIQYIWISKLEINNKLKKKAIEILGGINEFYNSSLDDLVYLGFNDNNISKILDFKLKKEALKDYEYLLKHSIDIIGIEDTDYPQKLKLINEKPITLYIRGNKNVINEDCLGIVGSRIAEKESLYVAKEIAKIVSLNEINVISGLARGIDKFAHLGCLEINKGKTIAVMGTGIDDESIYPFENKKVFDRILENEGLIISEYPLKTKPLPYNFPYRNRIISGLSDGIVVVQASKNSGSLITVDYAIEQGKDVYVYKGKSIDKEYFAGNKMLIESK